MTTKTPAPKSNSGWHRLLHPWFVIPVMIVVLLIAAPFMYRSYKLSIISDPGEPFDVEAFISAHTLADTDNALVSFRNAIGTLKGTIPGKEIGETYGILWDGTPPDARMQVALDFVTNNEAALLIWEKASHLPNFAELQPKTINSSSLLETTQTIRDLARMGAIRAWMASNSGNDAEAAKWLLCNLRTSRLIEQNGCIINRLVGNAIQNMTSQLIVKWLAHQKLSQDELEQFLNDVKSIHQMTPPISDHIKMEYLMLMNSVNSFQLKTIPGSAPVISNSVLQWVFYFQGEPELLHRVYSHCIANNLLYVDLPKNKRPNLYASAGKERYLFEPPSGYLFPSSQPTPAKIDEAAQSSPLFGTAYYSIDQFMNAVDMESLRQRLLETAIQLEIYRKINGEFPDKLAQAYLTTEELPIDDLEPTGAVLNYVKEGPLHYRLWSVGADGIDSGGVNLTLDREAADLGIEMIRNDSLESPEEK
ncbi:hypothetical protein [uncultured Rubinisphaera sp.]|uniref:hypothetical protein n=1 Tax=uncultured Rubinisphaera sp. TaxID=1678686 RepID=UPI0030DAB5A4